jgi:hypothetical protein
MQESARILSLAKKFAGELYRRWRALRGDVRERVVEEDHYQLRADGGRPSQRPFAFATDSEKISDFMNWYQARVDERVIEPVGERQLRQGAHWTAKFVRGTNASGLRDAGTRLREAGVTPQTGRENIEAVFNLPVRTDQLATLYQRTFRELRGIGEATGQQISRELSDALAGGENPRKVARRINDRIDKVGETRSRVLARTELNRSYNHASLLRYERNGIGEVDIINTTPCDECKPYAKDGSEPYRGPYTLAEAMGTLPIHPSCQGAYSPRVGGAT